MWSTEDDNRWHIPGMMWVVNVPHKWRLGILIPNSRDLCFLFFPPVSPMSPHTTSHHILVKIRPQTRNLLKLRVRVRDSAPDLLLALFPCGKSPWKGGSELNLGQVYSTETKAEQLWLLSSFFNCIFLFPGRPEQAGGWCHGGEEGCNFLPTLLLTVWWKTWQEGK